MDSLSIKYETQIDLIFRLYLYLYLSLNLYLLVLKSTFIFSFSNPSFPRHPLKN